jgi:hypothetical protein
MHTNQSQSPIALFIKNNNNLMNIKYYSDA